MAGFNVKIEMIGDSATAMLSSTRLKIKSAIGVGMFRIGNELVNFSRPIAPFKSGTLRRAINFDVINNSAVDFGVNLGTIPYARIREFGGTIRAKNKPFLVFKINGQWIRKRQVIQRGANGGKGYLRPSMERMRAGRAIKILDEEIQYLLNK